MLHNVLNKRQLHDYLSPISQNIQKEYMLDTAGKAKMNS